MSKFKFKIGDRVKPFGTQYANCDGCHGTVISAYESGYSGDNRYEVRWDNGNIVKYSENQIKALDKVERISEALGITIGKSFSLVDPETGDAYCSPYTMDSDGEILDAEGNHLALDEYEAIIKGYVVPNAILADFQEVTDRIERLANDIECMEAQREELLKR